jgi:hypothetical protein
VERRSTELCAMRMGSDFLAPLFFEKTEMAILPIQAAEI